MKHISKIMNDMKWNNCCGMYELHYGDCEFALQRVTELQSKLPPKNYKLNLNEIDE